METKFTGESSWQTDAKDVTFLESRYVEFARPKEGKDSRVVGVFRFYLLTREKSEVR